MKRRIQSKLLTTILFTLTVVLVATLGTFLYWIYAPTDALTIKNAPFPVRIGSNGADRVVILKIDYCKNLKATGQVRTSFVSRASETFLPMATDFQPPTCLNTDIPVLIPPTLPSGTYKIHFRITYKVNPIRTTVEDFSSKSFTL
jgi:hypothetical protein